jgi:oligosaccharide repeat unit polymerase
MQGVTATVTPAKGGRTGMATLLGVSLVVVALASIEIQSSFSIGENWATPIALVTLIWLGCYSATTWLYFGHPYLFSNAYVAALAIFHLGLLVPFGLGMVDVPAWETSQGRWIRVAGWYVALALAMFGIGLAISCLRHRQRRAIHESSEQAALTEQNLARLRNLGIGLAIAAVLGLVIATFRLGNLLAYTRFDLFFRSSDPRFLSLFFYMGPTAAVVLVITARTHAQKLASYGYAAAIFLVVLLSGNRSWALFPMMAGVVLWVKVGRKLPLTVAAGLVAAVLIAIPTIAMVRSLGSYEDISLRDIQAAREQSTVKAALIEMGSTLNALAVTLEFIPEVEPYRWGKPFLIYLRQAIPNVGLTANQDYARDTVYAKLMSDPKAVLDLEPADWTSWKVIPESFLYGAGTGFSAVAEPYFSFGYLGVLVWFLAMGAFLGRMDLKDLRLDFRWLVFGAIFFWSLPVTSRNSFGVFTKPAALILAVLAIWIAVRRFTPFRVPGRRPRLRPSAF